MSEGKRKRVDEITASSPTSAQRSGSRKRSKAKAPQTIDSVRKSYGPPWTRKEIATFFFNYQTAVDENDWGFLKQSFPTRTEHMLGNLYESFKKELSAGSLDAGGLYSLVRDVYVSVGIAIPFDNDSPTKVVTTAAGDMTAEEEVVASSLAGLLQYGKDMKNSPNKRQLFPGGKSSPKPTKVAKRTPTGRPRGRPKGSTNKNSPKTPKTQKTPKTPKVPKTPKTPKVKTPKTPRTQSARKKQPPVSTPMAHIPITQAMTTLGEKMENFVKNPKALRWTMCEWFVSSVDRLIVDANPFVAKLGLSFPKLSQLEKMTRFEWFYVKKRMGKPRRFSKKFIAQQRSEWHLKRGYIRELQHGNRTALPDGVVIGENIPVSLSVGQRVLARAHGSKGMLYPGYVLAIISAKNSYRIEFDRKEFGIRTLLDTDVAPTGHHAYVPLDALAREKIHVPSAGIMDRPKMRRQSIAAQEKNRQPFVNGPNFVTSELSRSPAMEIADPNSTTKARLNALLAQARSIAQSPPSTTVLSAVYWNASDVDLVNMLEKLLKIKEGLVREQIAMNTQAQSDRANNENWDDTLVSRYSWIIARTSDVNQTINLVNETLLNRTSSMDTDAQSSLDVLANVTAKGLAATVAQSSFMMSEQLLHSELEKRTDGEVSNLEGTILQCLTAIRMLQSCAERDLHAPGISAIIQEAGERLKPQHDSNTTLVEDVRLSLAVLQDCIAEKASSTTTVAL